MIKFACIEFVVVVISPTIVSYGERKRRGYAQLCQSQGISDLPINVVLIRRSRGFAPTALPITALCRYTVSSSLFLFRFSINRVHAKYKERFPRDVCNIVRIRSGPGFRTTTTTIWDKSFTFTFQALDRERSVFNVKKLKQSLPVFFFFVRKDLRPLKQPLRYISFSIAVYEVLQGTNFPAEFAVRSSANFYTLPMSRRRPTTVLNYKRSTPLSIFK